MTTPAQAATTRTYFDVDELLCKLAWKFCWAFGGDFDDWKSAANLAYARAYNRYDRTRGASFITYCYVCTYNALRTEARARSRWHGRHAQANGEMEEALDEWPYRFLWLEELGGDARTVAKLVLESPGEVSEAIFAGSRLSKLSGLRDLLAGMGWTMARITESFSELREVMG